MGLVRLPAIVIVDIRLALRVPGMLLGQFVEQGKDRVADALRELAHHPLLERKDIEHGEIVIGHTLQHVVPLLPKVLRQSAGKLLVFEQRTPVFQPDDLQILVDVAHLEIISFIFRKRECKDRVLAVFIE